MEAKNTQTQDQSHPFTCPQEGCDKSFKTKRNLDIHLSSVHYNNKPFSCGYESCKQTFSQRSNLKQHIDSVHLNKRGFVCKHAGCGQSFKTKQHLKAHILAVHQERRPFTCTVDGCDSAFKTKGVLKSHISVVHDGQKRFMCSYEGCYRRFSNSGHLNEHVAIVHKGERRYHCPDETCDKTFAYKTAMLDHHSRWHSKEGIQRHKKEESYVAKLLDKHGLSYLREHVISYSCIEDREGQFSRVDFLLDIHGCIAMLEIDEGQHRFGDYSILCDMARMSKILEALTIGGNTLPIIFIRFNPHAFKVNNITCRVPRVKREERLVSLLKDMPTPTRPLTIHYLYYDCSDKDTLTIWESDEYNS